MTVPISPLVAAIQAAGEDIPPDAIVVRGYIGTVDPLEYVNKVLDAAGEPRIPASTELTTLLGSANAPARIYLTARLDCWIEIDDWDESVIRVFTEASTDRLESSTVWLRARDDDGQEVRYRVVTIDVLDDEDGFVAGRLVEDYMRRGDSSNVVWDEQQFGPTTGKASTKRCF